jgi:hypothetical protein
MERWRDEQELARADWWTLEECMRHLDIKPSTLRRYRANGLATVSGRIDGRRVTLVKRVDAQGHYRGRRHAEKAGKRIQSDP